MLDLVVADDDADYRLLMRLALEHEADMAMRDEAATAEQLIDIVSASAPDLVLLDASLHRGLAASARLRLIAPETRIVLTSSLPAALVAARVAAAGATGLLAKDVAVRQVPAAIRELSALAAVAERALRVADTTLLRDSASP